MEILLVDKFYCEMCTKNIVSLDYNYYVIDRFGNHVVFKYDPDVDMNTHLPVFLEQDESFNVEDERAKRG